MLIVKLIPKTDNMDKHECRDNDDAPNNKLTLTLHSYPTIKHCLRCIEHTLLLTDD